MSYASSRLSYRSVSRFSSSLLAVIVALAAACTSGCGGGSAAGTGATFTGNTEVAVLASSTGNDLLSGLTVQFKSVTLTNEAGQQVTLFATPQSAEFMHLNGTVEPLVTVNIPQGVYTSATASIANAYASCVGFANPSLIEVASGFGSGTVTPSAVTVNLPAPITVTGTSMGLVLNLQVSPSVPLSSCTANTPFTVFMKPTFNLTPLTVAAQPTNSANGKATGLFGSVNAVDGADSSFTVNAPDGPVWQVASSSGTVFQGISGFSQLAAGMPVDMDLAIQQNGSLLATRVAVYDSNTANLTSSTGPSVSTTAAKPVLSAIEVEAQGLFPIYFTEFDFSNAAFQISGQVTNPQSLPFAANFNASNMVAGQNVFVSSHAQLVQGFPPLPMPSSALTLLPQTINGQVRAISSVSGYTLYTVSLAPYDRLSFLPSQPGQAAALNNPGSIVVYTSGTTQMLNSAPLAVGTVFRFNGLVFNDNGTLRMDCAQVNDGVPE